MFIMNILSYNVRGLGGSQKRKELMGIIRKEKIDFICIQETKMEMINSEICRQFWGNEDFDWAFMGARGASGGSLMFVEKILFRDGSMFRGSGSAGDQGKMGR